MRPHDSRRSSARRVRLFMAELVVGVAGLSATMASVAAEPVRHPVSTGSPAGRGPGTRPAAADTPLAVAVVAAVAVSVVGRLVSDRTRRRRR
ncbi:hypothetical protein [Gordonia sp. NPDC003376]